MKTKGKWKITLLNKRYLNMTCISPKGMIRCEGKVSDSLTFKAKIYTLFWFRVK